MKTDMNLIHERKELFMVTIKDIAKLAGVSHTTVSRALNNNPLIKKETREQIQKIAKELNYAPNFNAKSLVNQKNYMIGLFFSSISQGTSSSFLVDTIKGIRSILDDSYTLSIEGIEDIQHWEHVNFQRYDGILVMSQSDGDHAFLLHLKKQMIPFVVVNRHIKDSEIINVVADDAKGVTQAIEYAISLGHEKIGYIGGRESFHSANERRNALVVCLKKKGLPINENYFVSGDYSLESGFQAMTKLLQSQRQPSLVFCANDDMAIGAIRAINAYGLRVPEDVSIIGFDDTPLSSYLNPPFTTVQKPLKKISQFGTSLLLQLIEGEPITNMKVEIPTSLVKRHSVARIK